MINLALNRVSFRGNANNRPLNEIPAEELRVTYKAEREELKRRINAELDGPYDFIVKRSPIGIKEDEYALKRGHILGKLAARRDARSDFWLVSILERLKFQDDYIFKLDVVTTLGRRYVPVDRKNLQEGFARTATILNSLAAEITKDKFVFDKILENPGAKDLLKGVTGISDIFKNKEVLKGIVQDNNLFEKMWPESAKEPFKNWTFYKSQTVESLRQFKANNKLVNKAKLAGIQQAVSDYLKSITKVREQVLEKPAQELIEISLKTIV